MTGFHRPTEVAEAVRLLAGSPGARVLAGGATLVAMMNARLAEPETVVSLADIAELRGISVLPDGGFRIGAFTRHGETASDTRLIGTLAGVPAAASQIANAVIRNMGTIGGSVSFADPGLDYPPALVAAGARIEIAGPAGRRNIAANDFFVDWYTTALVDNEIVTAVLLPAPRPGAGIYHKLARVSGDYATVSVAVSAERMGEGCALRVAIGACGPKPILLSEVNELLSGRLEPDKLRRAGELLQAAADPIDDVRGSAEYRRMLIPRMLERAVTAAHEQAYQRAASI